MTRQRRLAASGLRALVTAHGTPLLVIDCRAIREQYAKLRRALPGVTLYYALKPLPHPAVVAELRDLGACFDVATAGEIRLVRGQGVGAEPVDGFGRKGDDLAIPQRHNRQIDLSLRQPCRHHL